MTPIPVGELETRYYLRFRVEDKPGVLAQLSTILGNNQISIASVRQTEAPGNPTVSVVFVTHRAREAHVQTALQTIAQLEIVKEEPVLLRIEDFQE